MRGTWRKTARNDRERRKTTEEKERERDRATTRHRGNVQKAMEYVVA